jgi:hypothetical protein
MSPVRNPAPFRSTVTPGDTGGATSFILALAIPLFQRSVCGLFRIKEENLGFDLLFGLTMMFYSVYLIHSFGSYCQG